MVKQRGFALLGVFGLGVLLAGTWFLMDIRKQHAGVQQAQSVAKARMALLSYTSSYFDMYGPTGAGPGHFPCPDTDGSPLASSEHWRKDGPNPPCSGNSMEVGYLPRHVSTDLDRYHFHNQAEQHWLYAISSDFVNNPLNRIVNPSTQGHFSYAENDSIVALIIDPHDRASFTTTVLEDAISRFSATNTHSANPNNPSSGTALLQTIQSEAVIAVITSNDIRTPVMQRVAGWAVQQLEVASQQRCLNNEANNQCMLTPFHTQGCTPDKTSEWLAWFSQATDNTLASASVETNTSAEVDSTNNTYADTDTDTAASCNRIRMNVLANEQLLNDVHIREHWFYRNEWPKHINVEISEPCLNTPNTDCHFMLTPIGHDDRQIVIELRQTEPTV